MPLRSFGVARCDRYKINYGHMKRATIKALTHSRMTKGEFHVTINNQLWTHETSMTKDMTHRRMTMGEFHLTNNKSV